MLDTIIIGGGFAGLAAAKKLKEGGNENFVLIEARDRVGGRTKPGKLAGLDIDLGGMWAGPTQTRLLALAEEYQIRTYPTYLKGKAIFRMLGKEHHGKRDKIDGFFNILEGMDFLSAKRKIDKMQAKLDCDNPWDHPLAKELDGQTVEHWLVNNVKSKKLHRLFQLICFSLFCAEASQISMLFFIHYVKSGDGLDPILSAEAIGAQATLFHGSVHQIARKMGEELDDYLILDNPVRKIEWTDNNVTVITNQETFQARTAIVAIPPTMLPKIEFSPPLPQPKTALHNRLSMGSAIKFWVAYNKPFWREQGFNGIILRDDCPCTPIFDATPEGEKKGVLAGFFDGNHALNHGDISMEERGQIVLKVIAEHFGDEALAPIEYQDNDWTAEEWSGGCYGAYIPPGMLADYGQWLRKPIGPLRWAGTETSPRWTGYIDGAIRSGERAALEI